MKVEIKVSDKEITPTFPALYRVKESNVTEAGLVVLFNGSINGTVICVGKSTYKVGQYKNSWTDVSNGTVWERLPSETEVKLIQE